MLFANAPIVPASGVSSWRFLKRHQLVELVLIVGGICLAWLGVMLGSGRL